MTPPRASPPPPSPEEVPPPARQVHCTDAFDWLKGCPPFEDASVLTSLPDVSAFAGMSTDGYRTWLTQTARLLLEKTPDDGLCLFYQTDIKREGTWLDKGYYCQKAAEGLGIPLLWHKIVCRSAPGTVTFGRPAYTHLLCFSRGIRDDIAQSWPDVLPTTGEMIWSQATTDWV